MDVKFYRCNHCGNIVVKPFDMGVPVSCCGESVTELVANTTDAAVEKHVPVVSMNGSTVSVQVGSVAHPMTPAHLITFICLVTENGYQFAELNAESEPVAQFSVAPGDAPCKVYEYCNLHGLWVAEL